MNPLETAVLDALAEKPASGGRLIERLQAQGSDLVRGRAVLVYGALNNLARKGLVKVKGEGPGERVYALPDAPSLPPSPPGHPPSFSLTAAELALVEREVAVLAEHLPPHYFEEMRRVVVADADRRVFHGEKLPRAARNALDELGSPGAARAFLRRVERGREVALHLRRRSRVKWLAVPLTVVAIGVLARLFVVGVYTLPPESISMAPTLVPGVEGGDSIVLCDLLAYRFSGRPQRGEIVVLRLGEGREVVKRVFGLPGETVSFRREGDLCINGEVLVKDRALLDRVKVPLLSLSDYRRVDTGWVAGRDLTEGFRLPDGAFDGPLTPARDAVVVAHVRARAAPASVAFVLEDGFAQHTVRLETGIGSGVYVDGNEVGGGSPELLRLPLGVEREVWFTNADGSFRVEIGGKPAAPAAPLRPSGRQVRVSVVVTGEVELRTLDVARDLVHEDDPKNKLTLGPDEYFVLGDNAASSLDSRAFGRVPRAWLLGRAFAVAWPYERARLLR